MPTASSSSLCGLWTNRDALGNESALPAAGTACSPTSPVSNTVLAAPFMLFGVDIAPPVISMSVGPADLSASSTGDIGTGAQLNREFQVFVVDTGDGRRLGESRR